MARSAVVPKVPDVPMRIVTILVAELGIDEDEVTMDANLVTDLGADSLDVMELAVVLEAEYGVAFSRTEEDRFDRATVADVVEMLRKKGVRL